MNELVADSKVEIAQGRGARAGERLAAMPVHLVRLVLDCLQLRVERVGRRLDERGHLAHVDRGVEREVCADGGQLRDLAHLV